jgi:hypothetical protein
MKPFDITDMFSSILSGSFQRYLGPSLWRIFGLLTQKLPRADITRQFFSGELPTLT